MTEEWCQVARKGTGERRRAGAMTSGDRLRGQTEGVGHQEEGEEGSKEKLIPHCSVSD